jgi:hypothetical protein
MWQKMWHEFQKQIDAVWDTRIQKIDWLKMETLLVQILNSELSDREKVSLTKNTIDAYTRRGHFE